MKALPTLLAAVTMLCGLAAANRAAAITRDEVMVRAKAFAEHPWHCGAQNLTASCAGGYQSAYVPGDYVGLPYDWGGYMTLKTFDQGIEDGDGAGSYPGDGILGCTVGLDCSGYVSKCWDIGHYTTSSIPDITTTISQAQLKPGDVVNAAGYHVMIYAGELAGGWPVWYEAMGWNVAVNAFGGWADAEGFSPRRFEAILDTPKSDLGTPSNPIAVDDLPATYQGDTAQSISDLLDGCGAAIQKLETGPEVIYAVEVTQPGTLSATVQDDAGVDIDVHIYSALETYHCEARDDTTVSYPVTCGTWFVVADTWSNGSAEFPGAYTLTIDLEPSGGGCTDWNQPFSPGGGAGEPCGFPGNPNLPFCNPNLGAWACLYTDQDSFCTYGCAGDADCAADFPGGCCADIQDAGDPQDFFCLEAALCQPVVPSEDTFQPPAGDTTDPGPDTISPPGDVPDPHADALVPAADGRGPAADAPASADLSWWDGEGPDPGAGDGLLGAFPDQDEDLHVSGEDSSSCAVVESSPDAGPVLLPALLAAAALAAARRRRAGAR